jgi:hypothetical protein
MRGVAQGLIMMLLSVASPVASWTVASPAATRPTSQPAAERTDEGGGPDPIIPLVDFRAMSLAKAIDTLRDQSKVNIVVRWRTLEKARIEPASPVELRVANLRLQRVLELLGDVAGAGEAGMPLMARAERGVIILSTRADVETENLVRLYDVRDLVESDAGLRLRLQIGQATTTPTTMPSPEERFSDSLAQLKHVIEESIDPNSWRDAGGTLGSIHDFNGQLIIAQTPAAHERIKRLLEELRRK